MRRRLIVMRHAKSSWDSEAPTDHLRPLNLRGRRDAPRVARELRERGWAPERVFSSDATRTRETWEHMEAAFDQPIEVHFTGGLYHGGLGAIQAAVGALQEDLEVVLVLGHNPGFEHAVSWLTGEGVRITTANAALLEHASATSWREAIGDPGGWTLQDVLRPREI